MAYQQLCYTTRVYPETISKDAAAEEFIKHEADESYWRSALWAVTNLV